MALVKLFGDHLVIVVSTRVQFLTSFAELGATPIALWRSVSALYVRLISVSGRNVILLHCTLVHCYIDTLLH